MDEKKQIHVCKHGTGRVNAGTKKRKNAVRVLKTRNRCCFMHEACVTQGGRAGTAFRYVSVMHGETKPGVPMNHKSQRTQCSATETGERSVTQPVLQRTLWITDGGSPEMKWGNGHGVCLLVSHCISRT